ncbi:hypothetical protein H112_00976 [Trichophyton rubrum D6]|uniref:Fibronectin type-III domain-containing protein n=3 Tax=Trichophyton TaxID=5550 RepID=F2SXU1_TRIRC|nr:uncharacterized protein TERG_07399 [Trichophyton rubrum CBS 118892]EZF26987.1 hypothetical protein H100_00976 [Trichophyton rubrum MR850]EZF46030.1 hypothetical protein H102_00967 [Trichophyton rubrum CBS 100081]EZF56615.1 hypothetical protein H103_00976 [Trichophyton rubrum CBS 288.86]EZF67275.1 hypothetical protein H104_00959 [Trichophyton rubrum CBS 289.86]EZF77924.1 hypothetical protein H105_00973 [Trichophyton soudanense CBS 452.61]EZF88575.1 hypothetical protein H110_00976 [Trichophy
MGRYESLRLVADTYPGVPQVRVQGAMALFIASSILWALMWLTYRAYQVCLTPNELLVEKLGLDIPPTPEVILEEIGATDIRIAWKYPELQNSVHKHAVQVNGIRVGETKRSETAVSIFNLQPSHIYHICVIAISSANFQTCSSVLHIRTGPGPFPPEQDLENRGPPLIQAYVPKAAAIVSPSAPVMSREQSGGAAQAKRSGGGRRSIGSTFVQDSGGPQMLDDGEAAGGEYEGSLKQLAERLKVLQQENESLDKQLCQEEKEYEQLLRELEDQRNDLKQRVKEKDDATGDLRKHINKLESINRTVQNEKSKREKLLQQKEAERKKRREDIVRWDERESEIKDELDNLQKEKARIDEESTTKLEEYRRKITEEQGEMKQIDEDIKVTGSRIKALEEERRRPEGEDNEEGRELERVEREPEHFWDGKMAGLRSQYASLINVHTQAQPQYYEAQDRLQWTNSQWGNTPGPFGPIATPDLGLNRRTSSRRRNRHRSSLTSNMSSPVSFPLVDTAFSNPNYGQVGTNSPTFTSGPAFFNINNGMTIPDPTDETSPVRTDIENPPMSPRADALLPSDLLGDEEQSIGEDSEITPFPTSIPTVPTSVAPTVPFEGFLPNSPSPLSSGSDPTSIFASPHGSLNNLHDTDRNAAQTTIPGASKPPPSEAQSASRRLSGLFGFNRQRGKTMADGPPLLGSLKSGQSQSFPRNLDDEFDPMGTRRRRLSYTTNWANPMTTLFPRNNASHLTGDSSSDRLPAGRRAMFPSFFTSGRHGSGVSPNHNQPSLNSPDASKGYNQFSPRHDPIDPSILGTVRRNSLSPRPSSTYSFENALPRPTMENQPFGWPSSDKAGSSGHDWISPNAWSRNQSRRPSIQVGSTGHLPLGLPTELEYDEAPFGPQRPVQAPIGTRPPSSHRPVTPKLNPAAPSFTTFFGKKVDRPKSKDSEPPKSREGESTHEELSPPASRRSKDARSIGTATTESHESLELVPSATPSESVSTKESFIQKLTRKGSSSKFNMPWKDRASLFSKKGDSPGQGEVDGDGTSEMQLGKSNESAILLSDKSGEKSSKGSLGFGFRRKSKKTDKAPSESSGIASETGDESVFEDT